MVVTNAMPGGPDGITNVSVRRSLSRWCLCPRSSLLPYLLAALFSVHSLIAGFALGVNPSLDRTAVATTVAIVSHKVPASSALRGAAHLITWTVCGPSLRLFRARATNVCLYYQLVCGCYCLPLQFIEAMAVGANFARAKQSIEPERSVAVLALYSCMTPLGILLGMGLASALQGAGAHLAESVALSVASGSFIYLAFHELSEEQASQEIRARDKLLLFGAGLGSMAALAVWA